MDKTEDMIGNEGTELDSQNVSSSQYNDTLLNKYIDEEVTRLSKIQQ